ncbi:MAG: glycosyltransferase family 4 protein [Methylococcaceae bacterium]|nr:glycosyltransferase family 4 protein [Methylococcaceae bacterium]
MIRILTTINQYFPVAGGAENMARQLVESINAGDEYKNDVLTFASDYTLESANKSWLPEEESLETPEGVSYAVIRVNPFRFGGRERNGRVFRYFNLVRFFVKLISLGRRYDLFHAHTYYGTSAITILAGLLLRVPVVVTGHSRLSRLNQEILDGKEPSALMRVLRYASQYVAISSKIAAEAESLAGIQKNKVSLVFNGISTSRFRFCTPLDKPAQKQSLGLSLDKAVIIFHGRLDPGKNLKLLIESFHQAGLPGRAVLLIVGEGYKDYKASLQELVATLRLENDVLLLGRKDNVEEYLMAADVYCLPSSLEGFSLALLEAMSSGLICLATDIDGNRDAITDRVNGFLFKENSVSALSAVLAEALSMVGTPEADIIASRARSDVETKFEISVMVSQYARLYSEVVTPS